MADYPYETHLDIRFAPLEVVDVPALVAEVRHPWYNQTLCKVNDSVVRLGVFEPGEYHWHKHDNVERTTPLVESNGGAVNEREERFASRWIVSRLLSITVRTAVESGAICAAAHRGADGGNRRDRPDGRHLSTSATATAPALIRAVTTADHAQWLPLWDGYNAFYGRSGPTALQAQITRTTWQRFFDDAEPVHALVAERGGRLLGLTHYLFHRSTTHVEPVCYLQDLFTAAEARGQGIGRALIEAVGARARAAGATRLYWLTHETNGTARRLYDQLASNSGFIVYRRAP